MFGIKLAPKGIKICPGCPPKKIEPIHFPNFKFTAPKKKDTKVVQIVNLSQYNKDKKNNNGNALF